LIILVGLLLRYMLLNVVVPASLWPPFWAFQCGLDGRRLMP